MLKFKNFLLSLILIFIPQAVFARTNRIIEGLEVIEEPLALGSKDLRLIITDVINQVIGLLGILAVLIILYAGLVWMTAGGNDEKIAKAKKITVSGLIGLVIILTSYSLANFVLNSLLNTV
jgi:hypothetical protein